MNYSVLLDASGTWVKIINGKYQNYKQGRISREEVTKKNRKVKMGGKQKKRLSGRTLVLKRRKEGRNILVSLFYISSYNRKKRPQKNVQPSKKAAKTWKKKIFQGGRGRFFRVAVIYPLWCMIAIYSYFWFHLDLFWCIGEEDWSVDVAGGHLGLGALEGGEEGRVEEGRLHVSKPRRHVTRHPKLCGIYMWM